MERLKPEQNKEFERLCRDFIAWEYEREKLYGNEKKSYDHFTLYGRNGDRQYGCDVADQDKRLIVQCKCYDNYDPKAHQRLIDAVKKDYANACGHFPKMERFVVCTNLDAKRETQDVLSKPDETEQDPQRAIKAIAKEVPIDVWFWGDLEHMPGGVLADNRTYAEDYEKPLFLHQTPPVPAVCLKNLFVLQKYKEIRSYKGEALNGTTQANTTTDINTKRDLWVRIGAFVRYAKQAMLILEGDAGCGKTSLIQALCWHDRENDDTAEAVLDRRPLLTVRLRDLDKATITTDGLLAAILDSLRISTSLHPRERKAELLRRFPRAVLVLDGFDELCIIDGLEDHEDLLYELTRQRLEDWKIIVTSRPHYIRRGINLSAAILELQHFDVESREAWLLSYTDPARCGQTLEESLQEFILSDQGEGVCDAPLTIYLLAAAKGISLEEQKNQWRLYNHLFQEELAERRYGDGDHAGAKYREEAYCLAGEIAHRMYESGNQKLWVRDAELEDLAELVLADSAGRQRRHAAQNLKALATQVLAASTDKRAKIIAQEMEDLAEQFREEPTGRRNNLNARKLAERCAALCCYWKAQTSRGAVEFYHNNIRDFFLCEYIYDGLNRIYLDETLSPEHKAKEILSFFINGFRAGQLNNKVVEFLYLRAFWEKSHGEQKFPALERYEERLPVFFQRLLTDGTVYDGLHEKQLIPSIAAIIGCAAQIYRASLEPFREEWERILWWSNVEEVNNSSLLLAVIPEHHMIKASYEEVPVWYSWFSGGVFAGLDLSGLNLKYSDFWYADLHDANLQGAILGGAYLQNANLQSANLMGVSLPEADLRGAELQRADLRTADLRRANLQGAYLPNANLQGANLQGAELQQASFQLAQLQGAYLQRADLQRANLADASLGETSLRCANLQGAYLRRANLQGADLRRANLQGTDLREADLREADLREADLREADLRAAILRDGFCSSIQKAQLAHLRKMNITGLKL